MPALLCVYPTQINYGSFLSKLDSNPGWVCVYANCEIRNWLTRTSARKKEKNNYWLAQTGRQKLEKKKCTHAC